MFSRSYDDTISDSSTPWWDAEPDADERAADALAASVCGCGALIDDREPPTVDGEPVCAGCFERARGVE